MANDVQQISEALSETFWNGSGYVRQLDWPEIPALLDWLGKQPPLRKASERYGTANVEQHFSNADYGPEAFHGVMGDLIARLVQSIRLADPIEPTARALSVWCPDLAVVQQYEEGVGIGWHIDESANSHLLTAILTLRGSALLHVQDDPGRYIWPAAWPVCPQSLVLLRGNNLLRWIDKEGEMHDVQPHGRPRHMVDECAGDRLSLIVRMRRPAAQ